MKNVKNYLKGIPLRHPEIKWSKDEDGIVTLEIKNMGFVNRMAQKLLKKPEISYVHLDKVGSFVWNSIDGEKDLVEIGKKAKEHFGEKAEPLYERLSKYFQILESYNFIIWKQNRL